MLCNNSNQLSSMNFMIYACLKIALNKTACQLQLLPFPKMEVITAKLDLACQQFPIMPAHLHVN